MNPEDFDAFFAALYGYDPFPWQARLARQVARDGHWPVVLNLPTSAGKTAVIDIAVFNLALQAGRKDKERNTPLRTFFVVDRRIVVDEAFDRTRAIRDRLRNSGGAGILGEIARRLSHFGGEPLHVAVLRGGMYRDNAWAKSPAQPTVCLSTVDQVGSRLLFRGYGVSEYQRAIHAGLVGNDSLIILDEAHLSQPFLQTLEAVRCYRSKAWAENAPPAPFEVVCMSATAAPALEPFVLDPVADYEDEELGRRLRATKLARRIEIPTHPEDEESNRRAFVEAAVREARALAGLGPPVEMPRPRPAKARSAKPAEPVRVIGVVVNRVATARKIFDILNNYKDDFYTILLTGRIRPYDRDELLYRSPVDGREEGWFPYMEAKKGRPQLDKKLFVVATQTVEVGANLSFDALLTEAAPLDALRQRLGRLDRLGLRGTSHAVVLARKDAVGSEPDPIYGMTVAETWKWLKTQQTGAGKKAVVDFGLTALKPPTDPKQLEPLCCPRQSAPVMLPAHVDTWCQTSPTPAPDPDISLFLHGPDSGPPDVQIVWRADLPGGLRPQDLDAYISTVAIVPPTSMEALAVPIYAAQAWLVGSRLWGTLTDVEGEPSLGNGQEEEGRLCLRWRGPKESELVVPGALRPGDTIIVPAVWGGVDNFGWNPDARGPVRDVGDACSLLGRRVPVLRLHSDVVAGWEPTPRQGEPRLSATIMTAIADTEEPADPQASLQIISRAGDLPPWVTTVVDWLADRSVRVKPVDYPVATGPGVVIIGPRDRQRRITMRFNVEPDHGDITNEDDTASLTGHELTLTGHSAAVKEMAGEYARLIGLSPAITADLALSGWLHDLGKADVRFQAWLWNGDRAAAETARELLAKSGMNSYNRAAIRRAREQAGYPEGGRHECLSVALLMKNAAALQKAHDPELVLYVLGTHHGRGRPFFAPVSDENPEDVGVTLTDHELLPAWNQPRAGLVLRAPSQHDLQRLDSGWTDRYWAMVRRYGWWGVALLEAILQLADHRCSEEGERGRKK
jgi:CRISPR-associated endonuclease/helicase Cas3